MRTTHSQQVGGADFRITVPGHGETAFIEVEDTRDGPDECIVEVQVTVKELEELAALFKQASHTAQQKGG